MIDLAFKQQKNIYCAKLFSAFNIRSEQMIFLCRIEDCWLLLLQNFATHLQWIQMEKEESNMNDQLKMIAIYIVNKYPLSCFRIVNIYDEILLYPTVNITIM